MTSWELSVYFLLGESEKGSFSLKAANIMEKWEADITSVRFLSYISVQTVSFPLLMCMY